MDQEDRSELDPKAQEDRRAFLRRAGKVGIGVPATALLLSVSHKRAGATNWGYDHNGGSDYQLRDHLESRYGWMERRIDYVIQKIKDGFWGS